MDPQSAFMQRPTPQLPGLFGLVVLGGQRGGQTVALIVGDRDTAGQRDLSMLAWRWGKVIATASSPRHRDERAAENTEAGAHSHVLFLNIIVSRLSAYDTFLKMKQIRH